MSSCRRTFCLGITSACEMKEFDFLWTLKKCFRMLFFILKYVPSSTNDFSIFILWQTFYQPLPPGISYPFPFSGNTLKSIIEME